jgi:diketogulonate reductase-like aldo/keto reductase
MTVSRVSPARTTNAIHESLLSWSEIAEQWITKPHFPSRVFHPQNPLSDINAAIPSFLYGTAWKEEETRRLVELALANGFRGIDTANQRKHYHEAAVGEALHACSERIPRRDLFLQTKFTFQRGQDHRLPYDPAAPIGVQVEQSFASSLAHLGTDMIDSYLLHGPSQSTGLAAADWSAWRAMEALHDSGQVRFIGVSNFSLAQLQTLCREAKVPPRFAQIRCYANRRWDRELRDYCDTQGIVYQGFSLLTANRNVLAHPVIAGIARHHSRTPAQIIFRFALDAGMLPLTGTTDPAHMQADLEVFDFQLDRKEVEQIESLVS